MKQKVIERFLNETSSFYFLLWCKPGSQAIFLHAYVCTEILIGRKLLAVVGSYWEKSPHWISAYYSDIIFQVYLKVSINLFSEWPVLNSLQK